MTEMSENLKFASYAILYELSNRDFRRKMRLFDEDLRYYYILASGIIGAENARRMKEVPAGVAKDGEEFVSKLSAISDAEKDERFRDVLKTCLIESIKDELRCCCPNCLCFNDCIDLAHIQGIGDLFRQRAEGNESDELKKKIAAEIDAALQRTPYWQSGDADRLCSRFVHQYPLTRLGELFGRYSDIATDLRESYGLDYQEFQRELISLNMSFTERLTGRSKK